MVHIFRLLIIKLCALILFSIVFINAPHVLQPADLFSSPQSLDSEAPASVAETQSNPETALRGWWTANRDKDKTVMSGLRESILLVRDVLKEQRFDVSVLTALQLLWIVCSICSGLGCLWLQVDGSFTV